MPGPSAPRRTDLTRKAGKAIAVGAGPQAITATPDGRTVYVASGGSGTVTPIDTTTGRAGPPIAVGADPVALVTHRWR